MNALSALLASCQSDGSLKYRSVVTSNFKWLHDPPTFASVFFGSNDYGKVARLSELSGAFRQCEIADTNVRLVSLIGGMYFFHLVEEIRPGRVTLFDKNVMEHAKFALIANYIDVTSFDEFDSFLALEAAWNKAAGQAYQPAISGGFHDVVFKDDAQFEFEAMSSPITSLLGPQKYPEFSWRPQREAYEFVRYCVRHRIDREIHFSLPPVGTEEDALVVYLSNSLCDENSTLTPAAIRATYPHHKLMFPLYSEIGGNEAVVDPHVFWDFVLSQIEEGRCAHLWAPEDALLLNTQHDERYGVRTTAELFCACPAAYAADTLITHILVGKCNNPSLMPSRLELLKKVLLAANGRYKRVIIGEYNPHGSSNQGKILSPPLSEMKGLLRAALTNHQLSIERYSPGYGDAARNVFLCFDRDGR